MRYVSRMGRRRRFRSGSKLLSKGSIFSRKGRSSQARQIYALSRRLTRYIRRTRPETVIQNYEASQVLGNTTEQTQGGSIGRVNWIYPSGASSGAIVPPRDEFQGDFCRLYNLLVEGVWRYQDSSANSQPMTLRLVVIQTTRSRAEGLNTNDVFRTGNQIVIPSNETGYALSTQGPLQTGVSSIGRILYDRRYMLQPGHRESTRISFNLKRLVNYRIDSHTTSDQGGSSEAVAQGTIYVFWSFSCPTQDTNFTPSNLVLNAKLAYPDN